MSMMTRFISSLLCFTALLLAWQPAAAQSWTAPSTVTTGQLMTAAFWNQQVRDNLSVLRTGSFAVTSQAIGDLLCASSTTQFARLADVATGQILISGGVGFCPYYSGTPAITNLDTGHGANELYAMDQNVLTTSLPTFAGVSLTAASTIAAAAGQAFGISGAGTGHSYGRIQNTSGDAIFGVESSTGGNVAGSSAAYAAIVNSNANRPLQFATNAVARMTIGTDGHVVPVIDDTYNLGSATLAWNRLFLADGLVSAPSLTFGNDADSGFAWLVNVPAIVYNGEVQAYFGQSANQARILVPGDDDGTFAGPLVEIGRNNNVTTPSTGFIYFHNLDDETNMVWPDNAGVLRIGATAPNNANDTSGTVVGTQTSLRASKRLFGAFTDDRGALEELLQTKLWNFEYLSGAYNHQQFVGIVAEDSPVFAMDAGRSFNPVTAFGYTVAAMRELHRRVTELEASR